MHSKEVKKMIIKYSDRKTYSNSGKVTSAKVRCQGCGEWIGMDDDLSDLEYAETKRKTCFFFHTGCMNRIPENRILW